MPLSRPNRLSTPQPRVGVLAKSQSLAASLARELGIKNPVLMSMGSSAGRDMDLRAILVDDSSWPLDLTSRRRLLPCLEESKGYILHVTRHDLGG